MRRELATATSSRFSSKQLLDQDLFRSASWEEKLVMDSITHLLFNMIYRNVQIPLWPEKKKLNNL